MSPKVATWIRSVRKYHKWPGIVISLFAILFAFSGIILNHRNLVTSVDFSRKYMPGNYAYRNWNLSALRSGLNLGNDSVLVYGNIGIWLTDDQLSGFRDFNQGFPDGIDARKIYSVVSFKNRLVAGTHFGLFSRLTSGNRWIPIGLEEGEERISDLTVKGDSLLILTRNHLWYSTDLVHLNAITLPPPAGFDHRVSLFLTLWNLHSGELFGWAGQLFVDLLAVVLLFLSVSGLLHFIFPGLISRLKRRQKDYSRTLAAKKINLKWHNLAGYIFAVFLVVNTTAGMFLRPPLLIPISSSMVPVVPCSHLDNGNPWNDKLRRIAWNEAGKGFILYTSDGFYHADSSFRNRLVPLAIQPLVSIMGLNVMEPVDETTYLVGSFSGLYIWNPFAGTVVDYFTRMPAETPHGLARPVGQNMAAGFLHGMKIGTYWVDYNHGVVPLNGSPKFPEMTAEIIDKSPISLWNAALEVHTGRIFEKWTGPFYLLYVPLAGLSVLVVLISGFILWWLAYRKK